MKKIGVLVLGVFIGAILGNLVGRSVQAQTSAVLQLTGSWSTHTACTLPPTGQTGFCAASDGLWQSIGGAAFTQVGGTPPTGVSSITVCNAAGTSCGTAQTGPVSLSIPKAVTIAAPTGTLQ